ncbi:hypothetical protein GCM10023339_07560 [Alloalcanivorax gelatiniphagus]
MSFSELSRPARSRSATRVKAQRPSPRYGARIAALFGLIALLVGLVPALPASAAVGSLDVTVSITDVNGNPITQVDASMITAYRVNVGYGCNVADCTGVKVKIDATTLDPYGAGQRKEGAMAFVPPYSPAPPLTGSLAAGYTVDLGTVAAGTNGLIRFDYTVGGESSSICCGNFFPDGSSITPNVTVSATNASSVTGTASATWVSYIAEPTLTLSVPARINTGHELTVSASSNSGCWRLLNGVLRNIKYRLCGDSGKIVVQLPVNAQYVTGSGGTHDPVARTVSLASGRPAAHRSIGGSFKVTFPSTAYPTTGPGCVAPETFRVLEATYTYLDGTTKTTTPATAQGTVNVGNCAPFAKGSVSKSSYIVNAPYTSTSWTIPSAAANQYNVFWQVTASNQANVAATASITDNDLDQPGLPVGAIRVASGGPADISYTLDNGVTGTVLAASAYDAPPGRRIVASTLTSSSLAGPNTKPTDTGATNFTVRFIATVLADAVPGTRTNTAAATLTYPDNPELGTITAAGSPTTRTVNLYVPGAAPYTISASNMSATVTGGGTALVGGEVTWRATSTISNMVAGTELTPQYIYLAPLGWDIKSDGAALATAVPGATFTYKPVTYGGNSYDAVLVTWPAPVSNTGTFTLPELSVKTTPTGDAPSGTNNQTAYFFVGDAGNSIADAYGSGSIIRAVDTTDLDADGSTTDVFSRGAGTTSLAASPAVSVTKEICRPDTTSSDGCQWLADSNIRVGVPPTATSIKYRVTIKNTGNANLASAVAYDVLPYIGDTGTSTSTATIPRGSTVQEQLTALDGGGTGLALAYSTSTNPPRPEVYSGTTTGTWTAPLAGASAIRATITNLGPKQAQTFTYTASLVGGSADQIACNSIALAAAGLVTVEPAPVCATTQEADLSVAAADRVPLQAGRVGAVPFTVNNGGGSQVAPASVTITVPDQVTVASLTPTGWGCAASGMDGPVTLTCTPVKADGTTTRSLDKNTPEDIVLSVRPGSLAPKQLCFDAAISGFMSDPDLTNNSDQACSAAQSAKPELIIDKDDSQTSATVGETHTYNITATSRLVAETISDVIITDTLPPGVELVSTSPAASIEGRTLSWDVGSLQQAGIAGGDGDLTSGGAGSSKSVSVTVRVLPGARNTLTNTAEATGNDPASPATVLSATDDDTDTILNVFTDLGATETTPQNTAVTTPLDEIVSTSGAELDPTAVSVAAAPAHGTLAINATTGAVTYTPAPGYTGADSYEVRVCDTSAPDPQCFVATVEVTVGANTVEAVNDTDTTTAGDPVSTNVRSNDTNATAQPWAAPTVTVAPEHGTTTVGTGGAITYAPAAGFSGIDTYTYRACDTSHPTPVCDTATVTITVDNVFSDLGATESTPQNTAVTTPLDEIVSTTGAELDPSAVSEETAPAHGTLVINATTGAVTYTPAPGYSGTDSYEVRVCDTSTPDRQCFVATVHVTVAVNVVTAVDDKDATTAGTPVSTNVRSNDTSASGQDLAAPTIGTQPDNGSVTVGTGGVFSYTPDAGFSGTDSYGYEVCDTSTPTPVCDTATVTVLVANVFTDLGARATTAHRTAVTTPLSDMVKVTGAKVDPAAVTEKTAPTHGTLTIDRVTGAVTYTPTGGYTGPDSYRLEVCDTSSPDPQCFAVTVAVSVGANAVTAVDDADTTSSGEPVTTQVRANDTSASGQPLAEPKMVPNARVPATLRQPSHGTTAPGTDGSITYTPNDGFAGVDSYAYQVCDTSTPTPVCDTATVTVTVTRLANDVDLVLRKSVVGQSRVTVGDRIRYRLRVTNKGADTATASIKLVDRLPKGLELLSARGQGWECKVRKASDTASCVRERDLGAGKASAVHVVAATTRAAIGRSVNVASVSVAGESAQANNKDGAKVKVTPMPALPGTGFRHNTGGL